LAAVAKAGVERAVRGVPGHREPIIGFGHRPDPGHDYLAVRLYCHGLGFSALVETGLRRTRTFAPKRVVEAAIGVEAGDFKLIAQSFDPGAADQDLVADEGHRTGLVLIAGQGLVYDSPLAECGVQ